MQTSPKKPCKKKPKKKLDKSMILANIDIMLLLIENFTINKKDIDSKLLEKLNLYLKKIRKIVTS